MIAKNNHYVPSIPSSLDEAIQRKIDEKTKPQGALGRLETLAFRIARIQQTLEPVLSNPTIVLFAGDHGIAKSGLVNAYPQEVTYQMVLNFLKGGAAINVLSREQNIRVHIVDSGVNHDFGSQPDLIEAKMGWGTADYRFGSAMDADTCSNALLKGGEIVAKLAAENTNVIGFGEMGIGNTSSASLMMSVVGNLPILDCVGRGTGANDVLLKQKCATLQEVIDFHQLDVDSSPFDILATFGGFEIAQMVGGMLRAASLGMVILVDGFISSAAMLLASKVDPLVLDYAIFTHQSEEQGHIQLLELMEAKPLLHLGMRLGEGTGCATAYPLLRMAVAFFNEMASFQSAGVSEKVVE